MSLKKKLFLKCIIERNKPKCTKQNAKMFDLHYLYENTKCSLVGVQKTKQSKKGKR